MNPSDVRVLILDVDGVLTDGQLHLSNDGQESKCFHVHDGQGLVHVLAADIPVVVISARTSDAVHQRLSDLGISEIHLGVADKYAAAHDILARLGYGWEAAVVVGDDVTDIPLLEAAGWGVAVADARAQALRVADWITPGAGGRGAVRDVCDWILSA